MAKWQHHEHPVIVFILNALFDRGKPRLIVGLAGRTWPKTCSHDTGPMQIAWSRRFGVENSMQISWKVTAAIAFWCRSHGKERGPTAFCEYVPFWPKCFIYRTHTHTHSLTHALIRIQAHLARWHWLWFSSCFPASPSRLKRSYPSARREVLIDLHGARARWASCTPCHIQKVRLQFR